MPIDFVCQPPSLEYKSHKNQGFSLFYPLIYPVSKTARSQVGLHKCLSNKWICICVCLDINVHVSVHVCVVCVHGLGIECENHMCIAQGKGGSFPTLSTGKAGGQSCWVEKMGFQFAQAQRIRKAGPSVAVETAVCSLHSISRNFCASMCLGCSYYKSRCSPEILCTSGHYVRRD